ncbi:uncharacterized protein L969DRAFT_95701 [Mixia osmundae IAM 14324]|uniref:Ketoreductase (KR) domain-containing protein n=1 Tax=Mixia osmundae (strain CBS 9802 / IAM 14324 / JCM 22182 / KY 12970) TaxID=764103 RepID=G7EAC8_MIXOS|nr:uncharacterized protein L969DRAFT_95701 [Mixia osmundae IAM 14324]KEI37845.1 hypothetical protein L969DRAFT_95701 [Mixia osmundae IAM 14324]GAA99788.1 hypothetical protein E5Q_06491 [Mixia osmundae IAM 14324]
MGKDDFRMKSKAGRDCSHNSYEHENARVLRKTKFKSLCKTFSLTVEQSEAETSFVSLYVGLKHCSHRYTEQTGLTRSTASEVKSTSLAALHAEKRRIMAHQVVLISGANQGLGWYAAKQLSSLPNWTVLLGSRDIKKGNDAVARINEGQPQAKVQAIELDVGSDESIGKAVAQITKDIGQLDVLCNNAGIAIDGKDRSMSVRDMMQQTYNVNVFGAAALTEACLPLLQKASYPRVVNVSSGLASLGSTSNTSINLIGYNTSKTAMNGVTVIHSRRLTGGRVIAVCPGFNATNLNDHNVNAGDPAEGARIIVRAIVEGKESDLQTGSYVNKSGPIAW